MNINKDMNEKSDEEIMTILKKQNETLNNDINLKIKKRITIENRESWSMILELDDMTHQQLLERGLLYLGWQRCKIFDSTNVRRCFNCWGYGHKQKTCKKDIVCNHCAEKHESKDCKNKVKKCINCMNQKQKFNLKDLKTNHEATDRKCPHYLRILKKLTTQNSN